MDPTLVLGTWFESQFQICVYEHAILRIYISFFLSMMSLNCFSICVNDNTSHTGIFLTHLTSHFYVHFGHGHALGSVRV